MFVGLLGPLRVGADEATTRPVRGPVIVAVLARLGMVVGQVVPVEQLIEDVWAQPPPSARNSLQVAIGKIRAMLGPEAVVTESDGYRLNGSLLRVDMVEVEQHLLAARAELDLARHAAAHARAQAGLGLFAGEPLHGLSSVVAGTVRERATLLRAGLVLTAGQALLRSGQELACVELLTETGNDFPFDEGLQEVLLRALQAAGRTPEALHRYDRLRRMLADELGCDPSPQLQAAFRDLVDPPAAVPSSDPITGRATPGRSLDAAWPALPAPVLPMLGRDRELARITTWLEAGHRLVTVIGPGGIGKTLLATEVARHISRARRVPAVVVELAQAADDESAHRVALMACRGEGELTTALQGTSAIVVLDNAEHVRGAAAALAQELLAVDGVTVVVTTQRALDVAGETVYPLGELEHGTATSPASELLRRGAGTTDGDLDPTTAEAIRSLSVRAEGVPLVLELLAAALRWTPATQLVTDFDAFLEGHDGTPVLGRPDRHTSVAAAVSWSVNALTPSARSALGALGVCRGTFALDAALAILDPSHGRDARRCVMELVDSSLVQRLSGPGAVELKMLEPIRAAARRSPAVPAPGVAHLRAHAHHYLSSAADVLSPPDDPMSPLMAHLRAHEPNILGALTWSWEHDRDLALRGLPAVALAWHFLDRHDDVLSWSARALGAGELGHPGVLRTGVVRLGALAWLGSHAAEAERLARGCMDHADLLEPFWRFRLVVAASTLAVNRRDFAEAEEVLKDAVPVLTTDAVRLALQRAVTLSHLGRFAEALTVAQQALDTHTDGGAGLRMTILNAVGYLLMVQGHRQEAQEPLEEALSLATTFGLPGQGCMTLLNLAWLRLQDGEPTAALRLVSQVFEMGDVAQVDAVTRNEALLVTALALVHQGETILASDIASVLTTPVVDTSLGLDAFGLAQLEQLRRAVPPRQGAPPELAHLIGRIGTRLEVRGP